MGKLSLPIEYYIAARYLRHNMRNSFIVALAVGIGVSIIIFIPSVNLSFFQDLLTKTVENAPHIRVTKETDTFRENQPLVLETLKAQVASPSPDSTDKTAMILMSDQTVTRRRQLKAYRRLMADLGHIPGVTEVAPYITEQIIISHGSRVRGAGLKGIDPEKERRITRIESDIQVGNLSTLTGDQVFLGWRLAKELGAELGNRVQLVTARGSKSYRITGLIKSGIYATDMETVLMALPSAQKLLNLSNEVTGISVKMKDFYQAKQLASAIEASYQVKTQSWMEDNEVILEQIANFKVIIGFISFLIVFAAATSITSILVMVVASKSKEIGILKSMGMSPDALIRLFMIQAIFLSILGSCCGVLGGMLLIAIFNATPFATAETVLGVARQPVRLNFEYVGYAVMYAMVSSLLASLIPAWQAGRLDPVKAINQQ